MWSAERTNVQAIPDNDDLAVAKGLLSPEFRKPMPGVGLEKTADGGHTTQSGLGNQVTSRCWGIPTGIATNTAMGLMTPFGGAPGYEAVVPSAEDQAKQVISLRRLQPSIFLDVRGICCHMMSSGK